MVSKSQPVPTQFVTFGSSAYSVTAIVEKNIQETEGGAVAENYQRLSRASQGEIAPIFQLQPLHSS